MNANRQVILSGLWFVIGLMVTVLMHAPGAWAHESRPAYLEINQVSRDRYEVLWHTPLLVGLRLPVVLRFPDTVHNVTEPVQRELPGSLVERRLVEAAAGLEGKSVLRQDKSRKGGREI